MVSHIIYEKDALDALKRGVDHVANAVKTTIGPNGRNVIICDEHEGIHVTKDGVTVTRNIWPEDKFEKIGATIMRSVAEKALAEAGDGTSSATVIAQELLRSGMDAISNGADPLKLKKEIEEASKLLIGRLKEMSIPADDYIYNVAFVSSNGDEEMSKLVAEAFSHVGRDGHVYATSANKKESSVELSRGFKYDQGYISPFFVTNPSKLTAEYDDAVVLVVDRVLNSLKPIVKVVEACSKTNSPLVIVAPDVTGELLQALILNHVKGTFKSVCVRPPMYGDARKQSMIDLAAYLGATYVSEEMGNYSEDLKIEYTGKCSKVVIDASSCVFVGGGGFSESVDKRVLEIKTLLEKSEDNDLKMRLARLSGGTACINIGANSEVEQRERMDRADDAIKACVSALKEGIVAGSGISAIRAAMCFTKELGTRGGQMLTLAVQEPMRCMVENGGESMDDVLIDLLGNGVETAYNARSGKIENAFKSGVVDPLKVVCTSISSASSIIGLFLTTSCIIKNKSNAQVN